VPEQLHALLVLPLLGAPRLQPELHRFRQHLAQVYTTLDLAVPLAVNRPIHRATGGHVVPPTRWATPAVDGVVTDYFEWLYAGRVDCAKARGTMAPGQDRLQRVWWLCDQRYWYVRLDLVTWPMEAPLTITFMAEQPPFQLDLVLGGTRADAMWRIGQPDGSWGPLNRVELLAADRIVELGVPLEALGLRHGTVVTGRFQVWQEGVVVETVPTTGILALTLPGEPDAHALWSA